MPENTLDILYHHFLSSSGVCTDTRKLVPGCLFFALKGPNFDANQMAETALDQGAALAVVDSESVFSASRRPSQLFLVSDVLRCLQDLSTLHRQSLNTPLLAIGGSNGKTTTKELVYRVLAQKFNTIATQGNLNNHIGVPLSLLQLTPETEMAVIELGTNQPGDIQELVEICEPDFGLITNIGKEHLEGFGSLEGVAREESALFLYLQKERGLAFVNLDDPWLAQMGERLDRVLSFGTKEEAGVYGTLLQSQPGVKLEMDNGFISESHLPGAFNQYNILAAWAVGRHFKVDDHLIAEAIASYVPGNNRSQWKEASGYQFLLDCYNANPSSMELALRSIAENEGEKVVVLGDMLELGSHAPSEHQAILKLLDELQLKKVVLIGPEFKALNARFPSFEKAEEAAEYLKANAPSAGSLILLKGSRGIAVEKAVAHWLGVKF